MCPGDILCGGLGTLEGQFLAGTYLGKTEGRQLAHGTLDLMSLNLDIQADL